jgi:hypothetical protein
LDKPPIFLRQKEIDKAYTICIYDVMYAKMEKNGIKTPVVIFLMEDDKRNKYKAIHSTELLERVLHEYEMYAKNKLEEK